MAGGGDEGKVDGQVWVRGQSVDTGCVFREYKRSRGIVLSSPSQ